MIPAWILATAAAQATVPDAFGVGARWSGAGGAGVAVVEDGAAALVNPAGLSRVRRATAALGWTGVFPSVRPIPAVWWDTNRDGQIDERDPPLHYDASFEATNGVQVQAARPLGGKFGLGFTGFVPTTNLIRFETFEPSLPNYIMWDNRLQRFSFQAGLAGEILPGLSLGVAADMLARARLTVQLTADIQASLDGTTSSSGTATDLGQLVTQATIDVHQISVAVVPSVAPIFGVQWDVGKVLPALDGLVLGAAYHPQIGLPIDVDLDLQANLAASDIGEFEPFVGAAVADSTLTLFDHFVPQHVSLGLGYRRSETLLLYLDAQWTDWRKMTLNVAQLQSAILSAPFLDIPDDSIVDGNRYVVGLRSVWSGHMGSELRLPKAELKGKLKYLQTSVRGGFGYIPSPLVSQGPDTAFLDAARTQFTLGAGLEHWDPFGLNDGPVRYDLFFQYNLLANSTLLHSSDVPAAGFPVDPTAGIPIGGSIVVFGGQWGFDY